MENLQEILLLLLLMILLIKTHKKITQNRSGKQVKTTINTPISNYIDTLAKERKLSHGEEILGERHKHKCL